MSTTAPVNWEALVQQAGGTVSAPPAPPPMKDWGALVKQAGGTISGVSAPNSTTGATPQNPKPDNSILGGLLSAFGLQHPIQNVERSGKQMIHNPWDAAASIFHNTANLMFPVMMEPLNSALNQRQVIAEQQQHPNVGALPFEEAQAALPISPIPVGTLASEAAAGRNREATGLGIGSALGMMMTIPKEGAGLIGRMLAKSYGLSPDLADDVAARVSEIQRTRQAEEAAGLEAQETQAAAGRKVQAQEAQAITGIEQKLNEDIQASRTQAAAKMTEAERQAMNAVEQSHQRIGELTGQRTTAFNHILADTSQALYEKEAEVRQPFKEIGEEIKKPVTDAGSIRSILEASAKKYGVKPEEIPAAATKALGKGGVEPMIMFMGEKIPLSQLPSAAKEAFTNEEIGAETQIDPKTQVSFNDLTRVREDLYQTARTTKDTALKQALNDARDNVSALQEKAAEAAGLGDKFKQAKANFLKFKRGIGSPLLEDWLSAKDVEAQSVMPKLAALTTRQTAEPLRNILSMSGVDVSPLDKILNDIEEAENRAKAAPKEAQAKISEAEGETAKTERELKGKAAKETRATQGKFKAIAKEEKAAAQGNWKEVLADYKKKIEAAQGKGTVVPGKTAEELAGKSNLELNRERMSHLMTNMKASGYGRATGFIEMMYGFLMRSPFMLGYGATRTALPEILKSDTFQDYALRQAGILPRSPLGIRLSLALSHEAAMMQKGEKGTKPKAQR